LLPWEKSIAYSECVPVGLVIQHAKHIFSAPCYIVVCCLSGSTIFFRFILQTARFSEKCYKILKCVLIVLQHFVRHFSLEEELREIQMYIDILVKYPLYLSDFNDFEFGKHIIENSSNIKFNESMSNGSRVVQFGQTDEKADRHDEASSRLSQFCNRD
jgi:hypothetical protein